jgi:hypothetical protein
MRSFILTTSIIALSTWLAPVVDTNVVGSAGGVAADRSSLVEPVARVCRQVCRGDFANALQRRTGGLIRRDRDVYRDRDEYRDAARRPGVEVETPGFEFRAR